MAFIDHSQILRSRKEGFSIDKEQMAGKRASYREVPKWSK
jgi:hypothetical protein